MCHSPAISSEKISKRRNARQLTRQYIQVTFQAVYPQHQLEDKEHGGDIETKTRKGCIEKILVSSPLESSNRTAIQLAGVTSKDIQPYEIEASSK